MKLLKEIPMEFFVTDEYSELKTRVHDRLLDVLDLSLIDTLEPDQLRREIRRAIEAILAEDRQTMPLNFEEKEQFCREVADEVLGLGPIEPFMHDPTVTDILVNTHRKVYVERYGKLHVTGARFKDEAHLKKIIDRIVSAVGRRIDESCPMVDARLADGSRVNAIVPPLAIDGACLSIPWSSRTWLL
jgi:pilus assembly protein CpaF